MILRTNIGIFGNRRARQTQISLLEIALLLACCGRLSSTGAIHVSTSSTSPPSDDIDSRQLIDYFATHLRCPSPVNSNIGATASCEQEHREWLTGCLRNESRLQGAQMVDLASQFGARCIQEDTCQRPQCKQGAKLQDVVFGSDKNQVLDNLQRVLKQTKCKRYVNSMTLYEETTSQSKTGRRSAERAEKAPMEGEVTDQNALTRLEIAKHLLNGDCLVGTGAGSPLSQGNNTYLDVLFGKYAENSSDEVSVQGVHNLLADVNLVVQETLPATSRSLLLRARRDVQETLSDDINRCLNSEELVHYYDRDGSGGLDKDEFLEMLAYIVYQISSGNACTADDNHVRDFNSAEVYGYGTLCVFIISSCSALGFLVIPRLPDSIYQTMMVGFIALAFGTLTADAIMHMLPESLLEKDPDGPIAPPSFWKTLVITLSIYVLFVFEALTHLLVGQHGHAEEDCEHGHSHVQSLKTIKKQLNKSKALELTSGKDDNITYSLNNLQKDNNDEGDAEENLREMIIAKGQVPVFLGLTSLALVIITGDMIHNVTDGISIGASFAESLGEGFSTALAVFFHELPHEFGDFVILLTTGQTLKQALFWNFISSLTAFVGLYTGIVIGENEAANQWIFAVTAGMFLYVAIADMLPELRNMRVKRRWLAFIAANIGTLFGIGFMVFMYFLEDLIHF